MAEYGAVTAELEEQLAAAVGADNLLVGDAIGADYARDEMPIYGTRLPDAVVLPRTTEEVAAVMRLCNDANVPVTVRGAGTGLVGGCTPLAGGVVLCAMRMDEIIGYDMENLVVRVQPGVRLCDLQEDALGRGLLYAPDPGEKTGSVGGNVATNAGGMRAVKYGTTRDCVLGMTVVLPSGEVLRLGGAITKSSSGYSLMHLMIGSEGTLGVITELTLKVLPNPKEDMSFILPFENIEAALSAVPKIKLAGLDPQSIEFMEREIVETSAASTGNKIIPLEVDGRAVGAYLLVTLDGNDEDEIFQRAESLAEIADELGSFDTLVLSESSQKASVWAARSAFLTVIEEENELVDEMDVVVPVDRIAEFLAFAREAADEHGLAVKSFGHAGDGNLHLYCCANGMAEDEFVGRATKIMDACYAKCAELAGQVSGEHGIGHAKKAYLRASVGETAYALMAGIKAVFDPKGILNPGKVCS